MGENNTNIETGDFLNERPAFERLLVPVETAMLRAAEGDKEAKKALQDREFKKDIQALIKYMNGRGVQWFKQGQLDMTKDKAFIEQERLKMEGLMAKAEKLVKDYFHSVEEQKMNASDAVQELNTLDPNRNGMRETGVVQVLNGITADVEAMQVRQRSIHQIALELIRHSGKSLGSDEFKTLLNEIFSNERKAVDDLKAKILTAVGQRPFNAETAKEVLVLLRKESELPPIEVNVAVRSNLHGLFVEVRAMAKKGTLSATEVLQQLKTSYGAFSQETKDAIPEAIFLERIANGKAVHVTAEAPQVFAVEHGEILVNAIENLPIMDRMTLRLGQREANLKLVENTAKQKLLDAKQFPEREAYYFRLFGADGQSLINRSLRDDYKLDFDLMKKLIENSAQAKIPVGVLLLQKASLEEYDPKVVAELQKQFAMTDKGVGLLATKILQNGLYSIRPVDLRICCNQESYLDIISRLYEPGIAARVKQNAETKDFNGYATYFETHYEHLVIPKGNAEALTRAWDRTSFEKYLSDPLGVNYANPMGFSVNNIQKNINLDDDHAKFITDNKLEIKMRTLDALANIKALTEKFDPVGAAKAIAKLVLNKDDILNEPLLKEIARYLLFSININDGAVDTWIKKVLEDSKKAAGVVDRDKLTSFIETILQEDQFEDSTALKHLTSLQKSGLQDRTFWAKTSVTALELLRVAEEGEGKWKDFVLSLGRNISDPVNDPELKKLLDEQKNLKKYGGALSEVLSHFDDQNKQLDGAFNKMQLLESERRLTEKRSSEFVTLPEAPRMLEMARPFIAMQKAIMEKIGPLMGQYDDPQIRQNALFLANTVPTDLGMTLARKYLDNPKNFDFKNKLTREQYEEWEQYRGVRDRLDIAEGSNILMPLEKELHVRVRPAVLDQLAKKELLEGDVAFDNWLNNPAAARPALELILEDIPETNIGGKAALIAAFCEGRAVDIPAAKRRLDFGIAQTYIAPIQRRMQALRDDFLKSAEQVSKAERSKNPIDFLKSGTKELRKMLRSRDKFEKGLGIIMLVSGGYILWQTWKQKGLGQKLMLGIPLFFGVDLMVKRMTGKGVMQRMGLTYMNEKDRSSALEQFYRRHEKHPEYGEISSMAGQEAVKQLMNPENPVPMRDLLAWRKKARSGVPGRNFSEGAPKAVKDAAGSVAAKIGSFEKDNRDMRSYEIMLKVVEAVCIDVAVANKRLPTVQNGIEIIEERYIRMDSEYFKGIRKNLEDAAKACPGEGFSLLDILIYEHPTPEMRKQLIQNRKLLESMFAGTGIGIDLIVAEFKAGKTIFEVYFEHAGNKLPDMIDSVKDAAVSSADTIYKWFGPVYSKTEKEFSGAFRVTRESAVNTFKSLGIYIKENGANGLTWIIDTTATITEGTIDALQNLYREMQKVGVSGEILNVIDRITSSITGHTISEYVLYKAAIGERGEKRADHVKFIAEKAEKKFERMFESICEIPAATLKQWKIDALMDLFPTKIAGNDSAAKKENLKEKDENKFNEFYNTFSAFERMALLDYIKRHTYAYLIAQRIKNVQKNFKAANPSSTLPQLKFDTWPDALIDMKKSDQLEGEIFASYGINTLAFLGAEDTAIVGAYSHWVASLDPGVIRSGFEFLRWVLSGANREKATEYLVSIDEFHKQFMKEAEDIFKDIKSEDEKQKKLHEYSQFLSTVLTNAAVEQTFERLESNVLPTDDIGANAQNAPALAMKINQAKSFLKFLRQERGGSPDPEALGKDFAYDAFKSGSYGNNLQKITSNSDLMKFMQEYNPTFTVPVKKVDPGGLALKPGKLNELEKSNIQEILKQDLKRAPLSVEQMDVLLGVFGKNDSLEIDMQRKFNESYGSIKGFITLTEKVHRQNLYKHLIGVGNSGLRDEIRDSLVKYFVEDDPNALNLQPEAWTLKELLQARNSVTTVEQREIYQDVMNRIVVKHLENILQAIQKQDLPANDGISKRRASKLVRLYALTNTAPDYLSDTVSEVLEYVKYHGMTQTEEDRKKGWEKYNEYLKNQGIELDPSLELKAPPATSYTHKDVWWTWTNFDTGSKKRMEAANQPKLNVSGLSTPSRLGLLKKEYGFK